METKLKTYRDVVALWRTRAALARLVGVTPGAARQWWSLDFIPEKKWMAVAEAATDCGFPDVTYALLNSLRPGAATLPPSVAESIDNGR